MRRTSLHGVAANVCVLRCRYLAGERAPGYCGRSIPDLE
jgi:hypothetical protein